LFLCHSTHLLSLPSEFAFLFHSEAIIQALERSLRIKSNLLIQSITTGHNNLRGTYLHRRLGLIIAQWISPDLTVQVASIFEEYLLFGKVELGKEKTTKQLDNKLQEMLSVDITEYERDDVLYIDDNEDKIFGKFGVISSIDKRYKYYTGNTFIYNLNLKIHHLYNK
jgi:hypothetical protein